MKHKSLLILSMILLAASCAPRPDTTSDLSALSPVEVAVRGGMRKVNDPCGVGTMNCTLTHATPDAVAAALSLSVTRVDSERWALQGRGVHISMYGPAATGTYLYHIRPL